MHHNILSELPVCRCQPPACSRRPACNASTLQTVTKPLDFLNLHLKAETGISRVHLGTRPVYFSESEAKVDFKPSAPMTLFLLPCGSSGPSMIRSASRFSALPLFCSSTLPLFRSSAPSLLLLFPGGRDVQHPRKNGQVLASRQRCGETILQNKHSSSLWVGSCSSSPGHHNEIPPACPSTKEGSPQG